MTALEVVRSDLRDRIGLSMNRDASILCSRLLGKPNWEEAVHLLENYGQKNKIERKEAKKRLLQALVSFGPEFCEQPGLLEAAAESADLEIKEKFIDQLAKGLGELQSRALLLKSRPQDAECRTAFLILFRGVRAIAGSLGGDYEEMGLAVRCGSLESALSSALRSALGVLNFVKFLKSTKLRGFPESLLKALRADLQDSVLSSEQVEEIEAFLAQA